MALGDGLIIGIDIQDSCSQVCCYDEENKLCESVNLKDGSVMMDNPVSLREARENVSGELVDMYVQFLAQLIDYAKKQKGRMKIEKICITVELFEKPVLDMISSVFERMMTPKEQWCVISHVESYGYYAYSQKQELYKNGVMLLDYREDGLHAHRMSSKRCEGVDYILCKSRTFAEQDILDGASRKKALDEIEEVLLTDIRSVMADRTLSAVYLTGDGFNVKSYPKELAKMLCAGRKAFTGQNLFVKGACYCGYESVNNDVFDNIVMICDNTIASGIELEILDHGEDKRFRLVKAGTNWYMAGRNMDFILDDIRKIVFKIRPCPEGSEYEEVMDISDIPYRDSRMTRINLDIAFNSEQRIEATVKDKGFGALVKSSGRVVVQEIQLNV